MRCPACDAIVADGAAQCWMCKRPLPDADGELPAAPAPPPAPAPVVPPPPSAESTGKGIRFAVIGLAIAIVIGAVGFVALQSSGSKGSGDPVVRKFVNGGGVTFEPVDNAFTVRFPTKPNDTYKTQTEQNVSATVRQFESRPGEDYSFSVMYITFSANVQLIADPTDAVERVADFLQSGSLKATDVKTVDVNGKTGVDATCSYQSFPCHLRIFFANRRLYVLLAGSNAGSINAWPTFRDSFVLATDED